jgi:hypothetical protein
MKPPCPDLSIGYCVLVRYWTKDPKTGERKIVAKVIFCTKTEEECKDEVDLWEKQMANTKNWGEGVGEGASTVLGAGIGAWIGGLPGVLIGGGVGYLLNKGMVGGAANNARNANARKAAQMKCECMRLWNNAERKAAIELLKKLDP